jgi:hypothetical protein
VPENCLDRQTDKHCKFNHWYNVMINIIIHGKNRTLCYYGDFGIN